MVAEAALLTPLGWLASPLIKILVDKAHHHLGTGIDKRRKILADTAIPRLSLAIEQAENSPKKEKLVNWLKRLKGAYYEAEDAIDLFEYEKLRKKVKNERRTRISLSCKFVPRPLKIASVKFKKALSICSHQKIMLKGCIDKLIEISMEANEFRDLLEVQENASGSDHVNRETISDPPGVVFGREIDKENIVGLLMKKPLNSEPGSSTEPAIPIIAITGRSGIGKTALAQYVYKFMDEQKHFGLLTWVHAPRKFNASDVIKNMIEIIKAKESTLYDCTYNASTSLEALLTKIKSMLGSKKLLLVLDDFWSDTEDFVEQWEKFISSLSSCLPGSRIILTTQSKNVAQQAILTGVKVETYYLQEMEAAQFSYLFMHYAWPSNCGLQKVEFEKIGQKIAIKLKGDPGAAKLVGHQLSGKLNLRYWEEVAEKDWLGDNMKARIWSYQQLPLDLQRCFAICCLFSKGMMLSRSLLIQLWMAEGFITRPIDKQERLEDIGENYLNELVSRFFIEEVEVEKDKQYQLHDLFHDLAEQVQGDDFIRIDSNNSRVDTSHMSDMLSRSENIRHILLPSSMINELKEKLCLMNNIRTFWVEADSVVPKNVLQEILKHMKKLRVLYLPKCVDDWPVSIGNLKHLRYLSIIGSQPLKKFLDSICKLYHLQNLNLSNCESLPNDFCELISLRRFYTSKETMSHISHVGRLTSLQGLDYFVVRKECGYELHQIENLNQLRGEMHIAGLENVGSTEDAVKAQMQNKKYLEALTFEWNSDERDTDDVAGPCTQHVELLEALQPQHNISDLTLKGFGGDKFPNWILSKNSLNHLTSLALMCCDKMENFSSIEESLPSCRSLILQRLNNLKEVPSLPPNLTYLEIDNLPQLCYCSEDDLLMKDKRFEVMKEYFLPELRKNFTSILDDLLINSKISLEDMKHKDKFLDVIERSIIFSKKEEYKLVLPSSLTILKISSCNIATDALATCIQSLVSLSKLELSNIQTIFSLPPKEVLCSLKNLQSLTIRYCYFLGSLGGIGALTSLIELELEGCTSLNISDDSLPSSLERLVFEDCSNVEVLLSKSYLPVLRALSVFSTVAVKNQMGVLHVGDLSCLSKLNIVGWNGHLEGLNSLTALNLLFVKNCPEMNLSSPLAKYASALPVAGVDNLSVLKYIVSNETMSSLENLVIGCLEGDSLDDEVLLQSLTSIKRLHFNLCNITHLPKNLKNLASLRYMKLMHCPNLCELEWEELPKNLCELEIENCPNLTEKLNKGGPYQVRFHKEMTIVTFPTEEERNCF